PQYSAQRPTYWPSSVGVMSISLSMPGMRSRFDRKSGTQNEWATSAATSRSAVGRPTGTTISRGTAGAGGPQRGRPAHGDDHLRRLAGLARDRDVFVPVVELPRPLEADHIDPARRSGVEV